MKTGKNGYYTQCFNRWDRDCHIQRKDGIRCRNCELKAYKPVTPGLIKTHLKGENITAILSECARTGVKGIIDFGIGLTLREGDREYYVTPCRFGAPIVIAVAFDKNDVYTYPGGMKNSGDEDATIVATHMILAAAEDAAPSRMHDNRKDISETIRYL